MTVAHPENCLEIISLGNSEIENHCPLHVLITLGQTSAADLQETVTIFKQ